MEPVSSKYNQQHVEMLQKKRKKKLCLKILFKLLRINMQTINFVMNNSILLTELLIFSHFLLLKNKEKATPILYKVSDYVLAMSSTCYVSGKTLWMHHFDYHETLTKTPPKHFFSVLITRFTMVVYLYNVKYFFVVKKGGQGGMSHQNWKKKDEYMIWDNLGSWGGWEGLPLLNFILMKWNFVTYCS